MDRTYWTTETDFFYEGYEGPFKREVRKQVRRSKAKLVSSLCRDGLHAPVLDIDFPAQLVPSSTEGHFHLYLDKKMDWKSYKKLLKALYKAGIIEKEYYKAMKRRGSTMVRLPGVAKEIRSYGEVINK